MVDFLAVQEERQKNKEITPDSNEVVVEEPDSTYLNMPIEQILEAEQAVEPKQEKYVEATKDAVANICQVSCLLPTRLHLSGLWITIHQAGHDLGIVDWVLWFC